MENEFQFNLTAEELETLHDKISKGLKKTEEEFTKYCQRHETEIKH